MDKYEKIILILTIGTVAVVLAIVGLAFYVVWKAVVGA